jgi:intracellular sulfur oxidation DsrE/DsrF family protein
MPITTAANKGVSAVAASAEKERIVLTSHGRAVAVVDSAERIDESIRAIRQASGAVLDWAASLVSERGERLTLEEVCARVGVDPAAVRERVQRRVAAEE